MAKKIVIALGGNALGSTLHEQADAVQITARAIVDLIAEGYEVIVAHGNGPQVGIINIAMLALMHEDPRQDSTPLSVCGAMSQAYIGYDLQNALHEEMMNRGIDEPVVTMVTQVEVDPNDPAFNDPSKPIGKFLSEEEAKVMAAKTGFLFKEDAGRGWRRYEASPKPQQIVELGAIRALSDSGNIVICCGGGGIPVYQPLPKFPAVTRDIAVVCDEAVTVGALEESIRRGAKGLLKDVSLFDIYRGPGVAIGKKSVAFNLVLRADDRSLTGEEADEDVQSILAALKADHNAVLR